MMRLCHVVSVARSTPPGVEFKAKVCPFYRVSLSRLTSLFHPTKRFSVLSALKPRAMDFPFGHHHHHHRRDDDEPPPLPPPHYPPPGHQPYGYGGPEPAYPPPPGRQPYGYGGPDPAYPLPPPGHVSHYDRPVQHVAHEFVPGPSPYPAPAYTGGEAHHFGHHHPHGGPAPAFPAPVQHVSHESPLDAALSGQPTVRIYTRAEENYSLSIRDGKVVLVRANPRDERQRWIKDMRYSTKVKDEEGFPAFALVNKVTGEALKHSMGQSHPVRLIRYNPHYLDESVLWTESRDVGHSFRCIRMVNNIRLNFDAFHGDEDHGGVHDGTILVLWEWLKGKNQSWKIVPY